MIPWLYKYVYRGFGFALLIAMITILYLSIQSMRNQPH